MFQGLEFTQHPTGSLPRSLWKSTVLTISFLLLLMFRILHVSIMRTEEREWARGMHVTPLLLGTYFLFLELGFPTSQKMPVVKNLPANAGDVRDTDSTPWRAWQPTPVFLPGESHGQRSLAGYSLQGPTELDTTEGT